LIAGSNWDLPALAEVLDLSTGIACPIKGYPNDPEGKTGAVIDGKPTVCGGSEDGGECFFYNVQSDQWEALGTMIYDRYGAASSVLSDGRWIITGGLSKMGKESTRTFEVYKDGTFTLGAFKFTKHLIYHCQVS